MSSDFEVVWNGSHGGVNADLLLGLNPYATRAGDTPYQNPAVKIRHAARQKRYRLRTGVDELKARRRAQYAAKVQAL